ncbi:hypothetical protein GCM10010104_47920 [Streptomyces indiaensis]|uniref:Uncharacterized protein n=1 Tax=Streptomyces indiaensis TaxID=284033 RepID=A0ABN3E1H8_9ACTN
MPHGGDLTADTPARARATAARAAGHGIHYLEDNPITSAASSILRAAAAAH